MNGRAPKFSSTGSHTDLTRNCNPNLLIASRDWETSSKKISPTIATRATAQPITTERKAASAKKLSLNLNRLLGTDARPPVPSGAGREGRPPRFGKLLPGRVLGTVYMVAR